MNNKLEDFILLKLGELIGEKKHRDENSLFSEVGFLYRDESSPLDGTIIYLIWKVGSEIDIVRTGPDNVNHIIATFYINEFEGFGRSLAVAIASVLNVKGFNKIMVDEGD